MRYSIPVEKLSVGYKCSITVFLKLRLLVLSFDEETLSVGP